MTSNTLEKRGKIVAFKVIFAQLSVTLLVSVIALFVEMQVGFSVFVGGMVGVIPNSYFALKAFSVAGARQAQQVVKSFYLGEAIKLILTILLFILAFKFLSVNPKALFLGYALTLVVNWLAIGFLKTDGL